MRTVGRLPALHAHVPCRLRAQSALASIANQRCRGHFIMQATTFLLFESASGFALFEVKEFDEISQAADKIQEAVR